jgi:tRNA modification GTPase
MFSTDDSIVAVATPPGRGGIGVVRISGPGARDIAGAMLDHRTQLDARHATFTTVRAGEDGVADEVVVTFFPSPHSYTGEHVVEISAHGSPVVLRAIVTRAVELGARLAQPGEFTLRAFLNGKRDLIQAEAIGDLIAAATPMQVRAAFDQLDGTLTSQIAEIDKELFALIARLEASLDFPDEGYHFIQPQETDHQIERVLSRLDRLLAGARKGRMIREGATVVVCGRPNVGKSSLFNLLARAERAIVDEAAGTTRDLVSERLDIDGLVVTLVDTAGVRRAIDNVEREGVARAERARDVADLLLVVLDGSQALTEDDDQLLSRTADHRRLVVANKSDLPAAWVHRPEPDVRVSAKTGSGEEDVRRLIARELTGEESLRDPVAVSNMRHIGLLDQARTRLAAARQLLAIGHASEEFLLADLQAARSNLEEIVGVRTSEALLEHIFSNFCVGK